MIPARRPRDDPRATRMLHVERERGACTDRSIGDLLRLLRAPDLLVVNDAATLPASLSGATGSGEPVEARLAGENEDGAWRAVLFGAGDWRTRTEERPPSPRVRAGDVLRFAGLEAQVASVDAASPRLVELAFGTCGAELWRAFYRAGRPVQYAHTDALLDLWSVQTAYAARPWAAEAPSAAFAFTWELLLDLKRRGVGIARVTHAAGLSSTGDERLDARLPLAERYEISAEAVDAIDSARARGGRVVAAGTTVARALEGAAANGGGRIAAGRGITELVLGAHSRPSVVHGILTGIHDAGTSHFALLEAFAPRPLLERAQRLADERGYRGHEFGDALLVL